MNKALYYPYINIPKDNWLTQSLLYWDELSCISPSTYFDNPDLYDIHMQEYIREQLVIPLSPQYFIYDIIDFEKNFINYIEYDKSVNGLRNEIIKGHAKRYTNIHFEKLGPLCNELIHRNLAYKGQEGWLLVESSIALKFMTYLAMLIGCIKNYDPITRDDISIYDFRSLSRCTYKYKDDYKDEITLQEFRPRVDELRIRNSIINTRDKILTNLLPSPKNYISAIDILRFKNKHQNSLKSFRDYVEFFIIEYESTIDDLKDRKFDDFIYNSKLMKKDIENEMNEFGWKHLNYFDFALYGIDLYTAYNAYQDLNMNNLGIALSTFGFTVLKGMHDNRNRIKDINKKPMAYVIHSNKRFS